MSLSATLAPLRHTQHFWGGDVVGQQITLTALDKVEAALVCQVNGDILLFLYACEPRANYDVFELKQWARGTLGNTSCRQQAHQAGPLLHFKAV